MSLIVFDLDGTLIDSRQDLADSANELIQELGGAPLPAAAIGDMVGEGAAVLVQRVLAAAGMVQTPSSLPRFLEIYDRRLLKHTRAYPGIADVLQWIRPRASLAVLTNKPAGPTQRILAGLSLHTYFDDIVGGDGLWPRKPDPSSLIALIARAAATAETTLLIGDSIIDYQTAARAAVRCCIAAYGFGYASLRAARLPDQVYVADSPRELMMVCERFIVSG